MHADSLPEAIECLRSELGATDADLAGLTYLQFSAYQTPGGMYRRVEEAWHLRRRPGTPGAGAPRRDRGGPIAEPDRGAALPAPPMLPDDGGRELRPFRHDPAGYAVLAHSPE